MNNQVKDGVARQKARSLHFLHHMCAVECPLLVRRAKAALSSGCKPHPVNKRPDPFTARQINSLARRSASGPHMWTAPSLQDCRCIDLIRSLALCSHMNAAKMVSATRAPDRPATLRPVGSTDCLTSRIDRSHHLLVSLQVLTSGSARLQLGCSPCSADFTPRTLKQ